MRSKRTLRPECSHGNHQPNQAADGKFGGNADQHAGSCSNAGADRMLFRSAGCPFGRPSQQSCPQTGPQQGSKQRHRNDGGSCNSPCNSPDDGPSSARPAGTGFFGAAGTGKNSISSPASASTVV
ncbi:MAG TPA: hypothetical protein PKW71_03675, partial [Anaerohalosphaeraceae bacterium]|nr:hypothetical protein [Anaerohalosphaeraceae bacterium]